MAGGLAAIGCLREFSSRWLAIWCAVAMTAICRRHQRCSRTKPCSMGSPACNVAVALIAWLHRDLLIERLDAAIDTESDDPAGALMHKQRQQREAEAQGDLLDIERQEAALVWQGQSQCLPVEHRADCSPLAILQSSRLQRSAHRREPARGWHSTCVGDGCAMSQAGSGVMAECSPPW